MTYYHRVYNSKTCNSFDKAASMLVNKRTLEHMILLCCDFQLINFFGLFKAGNLDSKKRQQIGTKIGISLKMKVCQTVYFGDQVTISFELFFVFVFYLVEIFLMIMSFSPSGALLDV